MLTASDAEHLLDLAEAALAAAVSGRSPGLPPLHGMPSALHREIGAFVTLTVAGQLNGCIGAVEPVEPLGHAVPRLALSAAFRDPRLPPLRREDLPRLAIQISLLSPLEELPATSWESLAAVVAPGLDGVMVVAGPHQGLFLPAVWEQLPRPDDFLDHLWHKAGLPARSWPVETRALRFTTECHQRDLAYSRS